MSDERRIIGKWLNEKTGEEVDMVALAELCVKYDMHHVWQPAETAPRDGTKILVYESCGEFAISHWYHFTYFKYEAVGDLFRRIEIKDEGQWNSNNFEWWIPIPDAPYIII